jgi:hypothetical protein
VTRDGGASDDRDSRNFVPAFIRTRRLVAGIAEGGRAAVRRTACMQGHFGPLSRRRRGLPRSFSRTQVVGTRLAPIYAWRSSDENVVRILAHACLVAIASPIGACVTDGPDEDSDPSPTLEDPLFVENLYALSAASPAVTRLGFKPIDVSHPRPRWGSQHRPLVALKAVSCQEEQHEQRRESRESTLGLTPALLCSERPWPPRRGSNLNRRRYRWALAASHLTSCCRPASR